MLPGIVHDRLLLKHKNPSEFGLHIKLFNVWNLL
jgi:hypothetical protein